MIEIKCDQTGEVLARDGVTLRPHLTLRNNLVYQIADSDRPLTYEYLPEQGRIYNFANAAALARWADDEIARRGLSPLTEGNG